MDKYIPLTKDVGVSSIRRPGDEDEGPPLRRLRAGDSLGALTDDYVLFSYAPLFMYGGMEHNPVQEWLNTRLPGEVIFFLPLPKPAFIMRLDLQSSIWDRLLWAVEKEFWPELSLHLGSMAFINKKTQILSKSMCQEIQIQDINAYGYMPNSTDGTMRTLSVYVFTVDSSVGCYAMQPNPPFLPNMVIMEAFKETKRLAKALFGYETDPYAAVEREQEDEDKSTLT